MATKNTTQNKSNSEKSVKEVVEKTVVNQEDMIAKAIAKALELQAEKHNEELQTLKQEIANIKSENEEVISKLVEKQSNDEVINSADIAVNTITEKPEFIFIPDETKIEIFTNISGITVLKETKGRCNVFLTLNGYKQSGRITFEELRAVFAKFRKMFESGEVAISRVYTQDKNIDLEAVIKDIGIEDLYLNNDIITPITIEQSLKLQYEEFEKKFNKSKSLQTTICEVAVVLYKKGQFNDNQKMNLFRQYFRNPKLFT
jgi:hypothetical protein